MADVTIPLSFTWVVVLSIGWFIALLSLCVVFMLSYFTPCWTWFFASVGKKCLVEITDKSGLSYFKVGKLTGLGTVEVKNFGIILLQDKSKTLNRKGNVIVYKVFSEFSSSLPEHYVNIITELKNKGYKINDFNDYSHLVWLVSNEEYAQKWVDSQKTHEKIQEARLFIEKLKNENVYIWPLMSYKIGDLSQMFPFNLAPTYIKGAIIEEVNRIIEKKKLNNEMWIKVGFAVLLVLIGVGVVYKFFSGGSEEVVVRVVQTGVAAATGNSTIIV